MSAFNAGAAQAVIKRRTVIRDRGYSSPCWIWDGCRMASGYGRLTFESVGWLVHRISYAAFAGPIPDGHQVDHLCMQKDCCNPAHLEAVTPLENTVRALIANGLRQSRDVCKEGHARTPDNLRDGRCRICYEASALRWRIRNRPTRAQRRALEGAAA